MWFIRSVQGFFQMYLRLLLRPCLSRWIDRKEGYHSAAPQGWLDPFVVTQRSTPPWFAWCCSGTDRSPPSWSEQILQNIRKKTERTKKEEATIFSSCAQMIYLTYGRRVVSLLTPHKLMRNCSAVLRLLLHFSLLIKAFQAFSISCPGRSSPY